MQRRRVHWAAGRWTRDPATSRLEGDDLVIGASEGGDFWRTTYYGFVHDDGHALLGGWPTDAAVEVNVDTSSLTGLYDQGQLVTVGASRSGAAADAVTLRARTGTGGWRTLRVAPFTSAAASAGPMVCAPLRGDLEVRFTRRALAPADADLHGDPEVA